MKFKDLQFLKEVNELIISIEKQDLGFKTDVYGPTIIQFPEKSVNGIFNRLVYKNYSNYHYYTFECINKATSKDISNLLKLKNKVENISNTKEIIVNENINYASDFFRNDNPAEFLSQWLETVFSAEVLQKYQLEGNLKDSLIAYREKFRSYEGTYWNHAHEVMRISEIRNDMRLIVAINPYNLQPELAITHTEDKGIYTVVSKLIYAWFSERNVLSLSRRFNFNFSEEYRYKQFPLIVNNEQIFRLDASPVRFQTIDVRDYILKGAKRQCKFYEDYFKDVLIFLPIDVFGRADLIGEECVSMDFLEKKLKFYEGNRVYFKPEFDLFVALTVQKNKDDEGLSFGFLMHYRPYLENRTKVDAWTWHHVLEDLGK